MKCPACGSEDITQSGKFDLTNIDADECTHDFECLNPDCETWFVITYSAINAEIVTKD
jgi:hypothetical protein